MDVHTATHHGLKGKTLIWRFKLQDKVKKNLEKEQIVASDFSPFFRLKYRTNTLYENIIFR